MSEPVGGLGSIEGGALYVVTSRSASAYGDSHQKTPPFRALDQFTGAEALNSAWTHSMIGLYPLKIEDHLATGPVARFYDSNRLKRSTGAIFRVGAT